IGALKPNQGTISTLGQKPNINDNLLKSKIGLVLDRVELIGFLTIKEYLRFIEETYNDYTKKTTNIEIEDLIKTFDIVKYADYLIRDLSHGTLKKVQLISSIIGNPQLIILDEPTNGLDFEST